MSKAIRPTPPMSECVTHHTPSTLQRPVCVCMLLPPTTGAAPRAETEPPPLGAVAGSVSTHRLAGLDGSNRAGERPAVTRRLRRTGDASDIGQILQGEIKIKMGGRVAESS